MSLDCPRSINCKLIICGMGLASSLSGLALHIPIEDLLIPPSAYLTDRRLSKTIDIPYAIDGRAFGVKEPLPISSNGLPRLPRVLREATMFVILDSLIKMEGLFRISPRAMTVDILAEAYDRAQKFIVWREGDVFLSHGHMREGTGIVYVDGLDQTEGYDVHAATALIKHWYKELRDPIFPQSCYPALEKFYGGSNHESEEVPLDVPQLLELLSVDGEWSPISQISRSILIMHLLPLLSRVAEFQDWNRMGAYNLSVCLTPCVIRGPDPNEDLRISGVVRRILTALIIHWKEDLAPRFGMDTSQFEDSLRMPEAVGDREDPIQEKQGRRTSLEAQISGITLVDNESDDEEIDERPALPPRPLPPIDTAASGYTLGKSGSWGVSGTSVTSATSATSVTAANPANPATSATSATSATPATFVTSPTPASPATPFTPVRRKPAPVVQNLPRYSVVIRERPATLEHIDSYNSVPLEDFESSDSLPGVAEVPNLPVYEQSSSSTNTPHASPTSKPPNKGAEGNP